MNHHTLINCFKRTIEPNFSKSLKKSSTRSSITEQQNLVEITEKMTKSPKMIDITAKAIKQFNGNNHKQNILTTVRSAKAEAFICIDDYIKQFIHAQYLLTDSNSDEIIHDNSGNNDDDNRANELYELLTPKGDVFTVARLAGIQAAKQTCNIIPLCHQVALSHISLDIGYRLGKIHIKSQVKAVGQATGVEMEALTAVSIAALTVYDMLKPLQKGPIVIEKIELLEKLGGSKDSHVKLASK
ncbi:Cyclic pyranopterin monophosphate synthase [Schistosoma japonicum]|uniref:Cyclic pyranopterin monophosphate synthase n=1 Tax=Schistosoma japonicum TaxID=6182 RepID=Q5DGE0_SCHJA|nr:SJCHGC05070 protein [Schistosoma japonicum]KAH8860004.1 Cyclic pyranopterin monophosphate synthase [Schistosoma japonicum]TNN06918.1 Cyclic pyranopterin monophosphate synthase [Schistosoma japonicum]